jgi:hypothetical protein
MPMIVIDGMDNSNSWRTIAPDGNTPSTELALAIDASLPRDEVAGPSLRFTASNNALDHGARRMLAPVDLTKSDELRLWLNGNRAADGSPAHPFYVGIRLGSTALPLDAPSNTWLRLLPVTQARVWQPVRLSVADLPGTIRNAVDAIELRSVAVGFPFACNIDDIVAVRDMTVTDVDAALLAKLDEVLSIDGNKVPAVLHPGNGTLTQGRPFIEITHYDIAYSPERTEATRPRRDFNRNGYALGFTSNAFELFYQVTANADDRLTQSTMLDFILGALTPRGQIMVNNEPLPMNAVTVEPSDQLGGFRTDRLPLFYRISARRASEAAAEMVKPASNVIVEIDSVATLP